MVTELSAKDILGGGEGGFTQVDKVQGQWMIISAGYGSCYLYKHFLPPQTPFFLFLISPD